MGAAAEVAAEGCESAVERGGCCCLDEVDAGVTEAEATGLWSYTERRCCRQEALRFLKRVPSRRRFSPFCIIFRCLFSTYAHTEVWRL